MWHFRLPDKQSLLFLCLVGMAWLFAACGGREAEEVRTRVDALNREARRLRYADADSVSCLAAEAYALGEDYPDGRAEALDHLGFCAIMRMDFEGADSIYRSIYGVTRNELHRLAADIGLMRVCQRTARNKEFYDCKGSAEQHIRRIADDVQVLDSSAQARFTAAQAEFDIILSTYYYYLQQDGQALRAISRIAPRTLLQADTAVWLNYLYMRGSGGLCEGSTAEEVAVREFDYLARCLQASRQGGYRYFEANSLQAVAALLADSLTEAAVRKNRPVALQLMAGRETAGDTLPTAMEFARMALALFEQYGDMYQIAGTCRTVASCLIAEGRYAEAVEWLERALHYVNLHHHTYYHQHPDDTVHRLTAYNPDEEYPLELEWTADNRVQIVPEWILGIREQLSLAYSGMDLKAASDYNRNIYLDLFEVVRQDKEWESRYDRLERETHSLNLLLWGTALAMLAGIVLFLFLNRRWKMRHARQTAQLRHTLELCRRAMQGAGSETLLEESPAGDEPSLRRIVTPYLAWASENAARMEQDDEETVRMEEERLLYRRRMAAGRRENIVKRACLSIVTGILPFIHRLMHEATKAGEEVESGSAERTARYRYMRELTDKIDEYNALLDSWIKMKQGTLKLHVESFPADGLLDIVAKSRQGFEQKGLTLEIASAPDVWVKGDRALTLFMLNTLLENARKYTPRGGNVSVTVSGQGEGVEFAVEDSGPGIPEEDIRRICQEKFYDPAAIGRSSEAYDTVRRQKGNGFGLMNCKGIIEKYRKTNELFRCCTFALGNRKGGGLRAAFVLPRGVCRVLTLLCLLLCPWTVSAGVADDGRDTLLLHHAARLADRAYYCNVAGRYDSAIVCIDSVMVCLNAHYLLTSDAPDPSALLSLTGRGKAAETQWLAEEFDTDYHLILDIRNEAAVAFLALHRWDDYRYNNGAYARLNKLVSRDDTLESYCRELARSASDKMVALVLCLLLVSVAAVAYYLLYLRRRLSHRFRLQQIFELNRAVFVASEEEAEDMEDAVEPSQPLPERILQTAWEGMNDLFMLSASALAVCREGTDTLSYAFYPEPTEGQRWELAALLDGCVRRSSSVVPLAEGADLLLPLMTDDEAGGHCLGALLLRRQTGVWNEDDILLARLLAGFIAPVVEHRVVSPARHREQMELLRDEARRTQREEMKLHVQNTVLDNCLSTIKHETRYYPGRIHAILSRLEENGADERMAVHDVAELVSYYKEVFELLSARAARQCEEVTFRRTQFAVETLTAHAENYFKKALRKQTLRREGTALPQLILTVQPVEAVLTGDREALCFLMENLIDEALSHNGAGELRLTAKTDGGFVRFDFCDTRRTLSERELNILFSPDHLQETKMTVETDGTLRGTEYLVCRQIIREHDEYLGHPGCRINAEPLPDGGGFAVWFTIPKKS